MSSLASEGELLIPEPRHLPALDGLRGLAILGVMLFHFSGDFNFGPSSLGQWSLRGLRAGWVGVDLFFVLSGFLITGILIDTVNAPNYFRDFFVRRILRIFPLYYLALAIVFVFLAFRQHAEPLYHNQPWLWCYATNILITHQGFAAVKSSWLDLGHFWSLAVEEHFYLLWPVAVLLIRRKFFPFACVMLATASIVARCTVASYSPAGYVLTPLRLDPLLIGALLADLIRRPHTCITVKRCTPWIAAFSVMILGILFYRFKGFDPYVPEVQRYAFVPIFVLFGCLTYDAATHQTGPLTWPVLRWLGKYSYGIYVWHGLFHRPLAKIFHTQALSDHLHIPYAAAAVLRILIFAASALAAAYLSFHLYEKHFLKLKRLFPYHVAPEAPVEEPEAPPTEFAAPRPA